MTSHNAASSAREKVGQWEQAFTLLPKMRDTGMIKGDQQTVVIGPGATNVDCSDQLQCSNLSDACAKGGQCDQLSGDSVVGINSSAAISETPAPKSPIGIPFPGHLLPKVRSNRPAETPAPESPIGISASEKGEQWEHEPHSSDGESCTSSDACYAALYVPEVPVPLEVMEQHHAAAGYLTNEEVLAGALDADGQHRREKTHGEHLDVLAQLVDVDPCFKTMLDEAQAAQKEGTLRQHIDCNQEQLRLAAKILLQRKGKGKGKGKHQSRR